jgi:hypothetical protein
MGVAAARRERKLGELLVKRDKEIAKLRKQLAMRECVVLINPRQLARVERLCMALLHAQDRLAQAQQAVVTEVDNLRRDTVDRVKKMR